MEVNGSHQCSLKLDFVAVGAVDIPVSVFAKDECQAKLTH